MKIPFHTEHCREGWGCMSACPVYVLTQQFQELEAKLQIAEHTAETYKTAYKETRQ
jgi:hypothetical protein